MKRTLIALVGFVILLNATEIQPFGKFKFGDSITPTIKKICGLKGIETVAIDGKEYTKDEFCKIPKELIIKSCKGVVGVFPINNKYIKNLGRKDLSFVVKPINIKGIEFSLELGVNYAYSDKQLVAMYLLNKNDTLKFVENRSQKTIFVPWMLEKAKLTALDTDAFNIKKGTIYNILKNKYIDLFKKLGKNRQKMFDESIMLHLKDDKGAELNLERDGISYNIVFNKMLDEIYDNYLKNKKPSSLQDSSGDL